jgi:Thaumarchaeal output domain 1
VITCPACHSESIERRPVYHHFLCAYVGPNYDFKEVDGRMICPKCKRCLNEDGDDSEIIGYSYACLHCQAEIPEAVAL